MQWWCSKRFCIFSLIMNEWIFIKFEHDWNQGKNIQKQRNRGTDNIFSSSWLCSLYFQRPSTTKGFTVIALDFPLCRDIKQLEKWSVLLHRFCGLFIQSWKRLRAAKTAAPRFSQKHPSWKCFKSHSMPFNNSTSPVFVCSPPSDCRAAEGPAGGVREQALPGSGEDRQEPEEGGADPGSDRRLEGGHRRGDRIFRRPRGVHPVLVRVEQCCRVIYYSVIHYWN